MDRYSRPRSTSPVIIVIRRSIRSATAPASGPNSSAGSSVTSQTPLTAEALAAVPPEGLDRQHPPPAGARQPTGAIPRTPAVGAALIWCGAEVHGVSVSAPAGRIDELVLDRDCRLSRKVQPAARCLTISLRPNERRFPSSAGCLPSGGGGPTAARPAARRAARPPAAR